MAVFSVRDIKIAGLSACVPTLKYDNNSYTWIAKQKREAFINNTGIAKRRMVSKGMTASDLCVKAATELLTAMNWKKDDVSLLVFVSCSPDYNSPATACIIQERLGLSDTCMAFDVNMACSGYVYGLAVVSKMLSKNTDKALLLVGDTGSMHTSFKDKSTFPLFGDAGTATAMKFQEGAPEIHFNLQTSGAGYKSLYVPDGGTRNPINKNSLTYKKYGDGIYRKRNQIFLDGVEILKFSLSKVPPNIRKLLAYADESLLQIDYLVLHQANKLINDNIGKILKIERHKLPESLSNFGNTISASIPLTIITALGDVLNESPKKIVVCGFGAGLSWGSALLDTGDIHCLPLLEMG